MRILVVYYTRTGVTRKAANALQDCLQEGGAEAQLEELVDTKDRDGPRGWLTGGWDAMFRQATELEPVEADVASFDLVIIGTPVWAFTCTPAIRTFCEQFADSLPEVAFFATMGGTGDAGAFREMAKVTGKTPEATLSLTDKQVRAEASHQFLRKLNDFVEQLLPEENEPEEADGDDSQ